MKKALKIILIATLLISTQSCIVCKKPVPPEQPNDREIIADTGKFN